MRRFPALCAIVGGLFWMTACGGNVVVDKGSGGSGATGATGGQGGQGAAGGQGGQGGVAAGGQGGQGGGPTDLKSQCDQICAIAASEGCKLGMNCEQDCLKTFANTPAQCSALLQAYLQCIGPALKAEGCMPTSCQKEAAAYAKCANMGTGGSGVGGSSGGCSTDGCAGDGTSCTCKGSCQGQGAAVECEPKGGSYTCTCYLGGSPVATCQEPSAQCDLVSSCCGIYFGQGV